MGPTIARYALGCLGWGLAIWLASRPLPAPQEHTVTKIEYRDRIVNRVVEKTTKRPDGTVTNTRVFTAETEQTQDVSAEQTKSGTKQTAYRLGLYVRSTLNANSPKVYGLGIGARLGRSPIWGSLQIYQDRSITAGLDIEF